MPPIRVVAVGQAGQPDRFDQLLRGGVPDRHEVGRAAVAEGDGACLVQQQRVDVPGGLHGLARGGQRTLRCTSRSTPAMPIADSSAPIVVGIRHTSSAVSTAADPGEPTA
jgi:hypothetical protein